MPDASGPIGSASASPTLGRMRHRLVSPLLRRILLVNALPLVLLVVALLYLDQYQNGLLRAEVLTLREQARIYAGALGQSAVTMVDASQPRLLPEYARPLLRRLTEPTPSAQAKLYAPDGTVIADSREREDGVVEAPEPTPAPDRVGRGWLLDSVSFVYDHVLAAIPHREQPQPIVVDMTPSAVGPEWQPDVKEELRLTSSDQGREMPPYIRRTRSDELLVTVAEPVERDRHTVGIILLTRSAVEVDDSLFIVRTSILGLFALALVLTVLLSWYLSLTIARPILRLADAASLLREGREGSVPRTLMRRRDEVGVLAMALSDSARALWARMDAIEAFAADVAHEIKNPLTSMRSAIETMRRIEDPSRQKRLMAIIAEDVMRLDRLISDISDASRVDAELSRTPAERVDVAPILATLVEISDATRDEDDPRVWLDAPGEGLVVMAVEDRLVQVLRNLLVNAASFSPAGGTIGLRARETGGIIEIAVEDGGPGVPDDRLEHIFDRFYSERPKGERFGQHSGLGLSITRQIVEALHGRVSAENRRDTDGRVIGARFIVRLPRAA